MVCRVDRCADVRRGNRRHSVWLHRRPLRTGERSHTEPAVVFCLCLGGGCGNQTGAAILLRFVVGMGLGGVWPNAVSLVAECLSVKSRHVMAGLLGAAMNSGILILSLVVRQRDVTANDWRWIFGFALLPFILGVVSWFCLPESPVWLLKSAQVFPARRRGANHSNSTCCSFTTAKTLFAAAVADHDRRDSARCRAAHRRWAASKWVLPWADEGLAQLAGLEKYKGTTQACWAMGAVLGSFFGSQVAVRVGRRLAYGLISIGATVLTLLMFLATRRWNQVSCGSSVCKVLSEHFFWLAAALSAGVVSCGSARFGNWCGVQHWPLCYGRRGARSGTIISVARQFLFTSLVQHAAWFMRWG